MRNKNGAKVPSFVGFYLLDIPRQRLVSWRVGSFKISSRRVLYKNIKSTLHFYRYRVFCCQENLNSQLHDVDKIYLRRSIELAKIASGNTRPNPLVGCVILSKEGKVVGEGYHPQAGLPHAEVYALAEAGDKARGGTLYVNLEPCNHTGRTPPCTEAILRSGISRVVVGMVDPDPRTSGGGIRRLISQGVKVVHGIEERACLELNAGFCLRMKRQKPLAIYKYAMSIDGRIATSNGSSRWISNEKSRQAVHLLRSQVDAIIVGGNTVRKDNPQLTVRLASNSKNGELTLGGQPCLKNAALVKLGSSVRSHPLRVVVSSSMDLPVNARIFDDQVEYPTMLITKRSSGLESTKKVIQSKGTKFYLL